MESIEVKEISQYGDHFLARFDCPICSTELFGSIDQKCHICSKDFRSYPFDLSKVYHRLIIGTKRKRHIGKKIIRDLMAIQENKCAYCSVSFQEKEMNVEHIKPLAVGGTNNIGNLCLSCIDCNSIASSFYFTNFYKKREYILTERKKKKI